MIRSSLLVHITYVAIIHLAVGGSVARADQEAELLQKFQKQNEQAALKAKAIVENNAARALQISAQEPEQALELLRQARQVLSTADGLARPEKLLLARKLDDGFRDVKARLQSKEEVARNLAKALAPGQAAPADSKLVKKVVAVPAAGATRDPKMAVRPILFEANMVPVNYNSATSVAPVVSPDRRWVRISFGGAFSIFP